MHRFEVRRRFFRFAVILTSVTLSGTLGFVIIERWPIGEAFYMTVITLSTVMHAENLELWLEECVISEGNGLHHRTVADAGIRKRTGANVLAIRRTADGSLLSNPPADMHLGAGDMLIALGAHDQLKSLARIAGSEIALSEA